jgi:prenyltransferase beta subunit
VGEIRKFLSKWKVEKEQGLLKELHEAYAQWVIHQLGDHIIHFHNAQPWIHYYVVHTVNMLGSSLSEDDSDKMVKALKYCFSEGFAGGYRQLPHLAPTYAGFLAALEIGPKAYSLLNREALTAFLRKMKQGGRYTMHLQGECDLRASYIATLITKSLKLPEELLDGVAEMILASQTHEGGISNVIGG